MEKPEAADKKDAVKKKAKTTLKLKPITLIQVKSEVKVEAKVENKSVKKQEAKKRGPPGKSMLVQLDSSNLNKASE